MEHTKPRYNTKQRQMILDYMEKRRGEHLSAAMIEDALRSGGERIGQATVYRTLERLEEEGVVCRFWCGEGQPSCWMYAHSPDEEPEGRHYHLVCRSCGRLLHVDCDFLDKLAGHLLLEHGFVLDTHCNVLYGTCAECSKGGEDK